GARHVRAGATLVVAAKGIERGSLALMSDVIEHEVPGHDVVALSGPSFAAEVAAGLPTAVVAASRSRNAARTVQEAYSGAAFRVYTHDDLVGVELGGALKNVMAVATGIHDGVGLGYNSRAALITRGLAEMTRLGAALGANPATFAGLAGLGDLVLTCTGALSRNRSLGVEIGEGRTLAEAQHGKRTVAEGVETTASTVALAKREGVEMPIAAMVHRILFDGHPPRVAVQELMARDLRAEQDS
ncbi:MAG: NAD(P)-dependent glycerol-3-phosphate dehydrogenase, partial [Gemmatimonadota bacterium]|nr:NAD(P)-dependent glycerol-3-phosphate dehydrogenase [Gemmatimonadota bacterium]